MLRPKYRYGIRKDEWNSSEEDWTQLVEYARANFTHTVESTKTLYFNASAQELRQAANALRLGTTFFYILADAQLEPSIHGTY